MRRLLSDLDLGPGEGFLVAVTAGCFLLVMVFVAMLLQSRAGPCIHTHPHWKVVGWTLEGTGKSLAMIPQYGEVQICDQRAPR